MNIRSNHVVTNEKGEWVVIKNGASKATKKFNNQKEAINFARKVSKDEHSELVIHKADGRVRTKDSYENSPIAPKHFKTTRKKAS